MTSFASSSNTNGKMVLMKESSNTLKNRYNLNIILTEY